MKYNEPTVILAVTLKDSVNDLIISIRIKRKICKIFFIEKLLVLCWLKELLVLYNSIGFNIVVSERMNHKKKDHKN